MLGDYSLFSVVIFIVMVLACLVIDLRAHKADTVISAKSAGLWTCFWIALSLAFGGYVWASHGLEDFSLFVSGYLLEKSLSVDNLFVMMAIFTAFSVPDRYQHRVLYYGIVGALVLRLVFVALGTAILQSFAWMAILFGLFVLWSAWKMWHSMNNEHEEIEDYADHWSVRMTKKIMPVHPRLRGHDFFVKEQVGEKLRWAATPLFLCLAAIEISDVMFAFDSVPAIIAITQKPFLVYTSNIFAILGLRSMFFFLAAAKRYLVHLEKAVIIILMYIGAKMIAQYFGWHIHHLISLSVVLGLLVLGVLASFVFPNKQENKTPNK